jgi:tetratricopeptide (TPR) repeat protein
MPRWKRFPYDNAAYTYEGERLREAWPRLHAGDRCEFPDEAWVQRCLESSPHAAPDSFDGNTAALATTIQGAWRSYHAGDFERAVELAAACGLLAHAPANKAAGIYGGYLETDASTRQDCFLSACERAEAAIEALPDDPNAHYFRALNLGRYSQSISVVKALGEGVGGKIQSSLRATLELEPEHAEAHTAMGMYHAEIIDKVGKMVGRLTYGANADQALEHFERALELTPASPIAHIEYGNGLYLLFGDDRLDEVTDLYIKATELQPLDAMEKLDIEAALAEME